MTVRNSSVARVLIADTTIRDEHLLTENAQLLADLQRSEVWRSAALSVSKRALIARQLSELGVDLIEAGFGDPGEDLSPLEAVASEFRDDGPVISAAVRALGDEERLAAVWDAISPAAKPRLHLYTAANDLVDDQGRFRRHPQQLLDETRSAVASARQLVEDIEFSPPRTTVSAAEIAAEWTQVAIEEGAKTINVRTADERGDPEAFRTVLLELIRLVPNSHAVDFSADPFVRNLRGGKAAAALSCAEAAIEVGCRQVKCAFHGIAGTPGHVPLELLSFKLWLRKHLGESHLWTGVDPTKLCQASEQIAAAKGLDIPPTQPLVGANMIDPQLADFPDDPLERAQAAAALQIVLNGLGRPLPGWLADWIDGRGEESKAA
jgi:2-isopropylmalate synthase